MTQFLQAAVPALAAAARAEAKQRSVAKLDFEAVATRVDALLLQTKPDADEVYYATLVQYTRLVDGTPKSNPAGGLQPAGAPTAVVGPAQMSQTGFDSQLSALGSVLPSTDVLTGTTKRELRADRSLMELIHLSETEVADLARQTRMAGTEPAGA